MPRCRMKSAGIPVCGAISSACLASSSGSTSTPSRQDRTLPGQVVQADVSQRYPGGRHPEQRGEVPLEPDGHVAQADGAVPRGEQGAGDDAHRVGEVDDESGGRSPTSSPFGYIEHDRHGTECLGQPAGPRGLLARRSRSPAARSRHAGGRPGRRSGAGTRSRPRPRRPRPGCWSSSPGRDGRGRPRSGPTPARRRPAGPGRGRRARSRSRRGSSRPIPSASSGVYVDPPPITASFMRTPSPPRSWSGRRDRPRRGRV